MTPEDKNRILDFRRQLKHDVRLRLVKTPDPQTDRLAAFCNEMAALVPRLQVKAVAGGEETRPSILAGRWCQFFEVPEGPALPPFLKALAACGDIRSSVPERDEEAAAPCLQVFVAPGCPFCPQVVDQLVEMIADGTRCRLEVWDAALFPEKASASGVRSVPTIILDAGLRWTGAVSRAEIREALERREKGALGAAAMERMIQDGNALEMVSLFQRKGKIAPAFVDLLTHSALPLRLGAMAVMEVLAETDPSLARDVVPSLWERFGDAENAVKGDILYIIGEVAGRECASEVAAIANRESDPEVRAAAREALEKISSRVSAVRPPAGRGDRRA